MLAPRKTLWSTPDSVLQTVVSRMDLRQGDVVCDVGCGDGRVLVEWASKQTLSTITFIGLEIDAQRAQEASDHVKKAYENGRISPNVKVEIHCANALEASHLYQGATVFFLYLIPRGLKLLLPILKRIVQDRYDCKEPLRVITYMAPLPGESYISKELCSVDHQPGAAWPLYLYHLYPDPQQPEQEEGGNDT